MSDHTDTQNTTPEPAAAEGLNIGGATAATISDPIADPIAAPAVRQADPAKNGWWWGTGRRKSAVARVRIKPGTGDIKVQVSGKKFKTVDEYFSEARDRSDVVAPLKVTNTHGKMDVIVRLEGGGYMGQAGAMVLGIARALLSYDPNMLEPLRDAGYLTRDPREVERKKYGLAGARRSFQFSKR